MKETTIYDNDFLRKVFCRKLIRGIARNECDLEWMSFNDKVKFVVDRLSRMKFLEARMILEFWERTNDIIDLLDKCDVHDYKLVREYKGKMTPGVFEVHFVGVFNSYFLEELVTKHYGYELAKNDILCILPFLAIDNGKQIVAIKLYDDRGFYEYVWQKKEIKQ